jgi:predicted MFS family arabinose efflux permease
MQLHRRSVRGRFFALTIALAGAAFGILAGQLADFRVPFLLVAVLAPRPR